MELWQGLTRTQREGGRDALRAAVAAATARTARALGRERKDAEDERRGPGRPARTFDKPGVARQGADTGRGLGDDHRTVEWDEGHTSETATGQSRLPARRHNRDVHRRAELGADREDLVNVRLPERLERRLVVDPILVDGGVGELGQDVVEARRPLPGPEPRRGRGRDGLESRRGPAPQARRRTP